jgi:hypothetical protein
MRPRAKGFGVKGSSHVVFWPGYNDYYLGVLLGMVYGDGNLIKRSEAFRTGRWRIEFCEGDESLVRKYISLANRLFNISPTIRKRKGEWHEAYVSSRIAYEYLTFAGEHPNGKKTGKLDIPELAKRNPATLRGFICGLFSVEGSPKSRRYVRLAMEMMEPKLIPRVCSILESHGFHPHFYRYRKNEGRMYGVYLYGPQECSRFLEEFGLLGKRRRKLLTFLRSSSLPLPARRQPGGGEIRRL